jgi:hypothetical protein
MTEHCGCWRCAPQPECQKCEALAAALRNLRIASTEAYKAGRLDALAFVWAGNVLAEYEASK